MKHDDSTDRLLKAAGPARRDAGPASTCLDPELLAAWADDTLTAPERAAAEAHAADCPRCLSTLAAMARTAPPVAVRSSWRIAPWLVPLTTAAVAMIAWVVVRGPSAPLAPQPAPPPAQTASPSAGEATPPPVANAPRAAESAASAPRRDASPRSNRAATDTAALRRERKQDLAKAQPQTRDAKEDAITASKPAGETGRALAPLEERMLPQRRAAILPVVIASPDPQVRWRISGALVERSSDGGRSWRPQPAADGVILLAGSAPAATVCWLVGRDGLVLLSTDGDTWRRLVFPEMAATLVGVEATDTLTATVTAEDGRRFRTSDGGKTWSAISKSP